MKCKENSENLISLIYNELDQNEKKRLDNHLKKCASCRKIFKELQSTVNILEKWEDRSPEMNLVFVENRNSIWQKFKKKFQEFGLPMRFATAAAVFTILTVLLLSIFNFQAKFSRGEWQLSFGLVPDNNSDKLFSAKQIEQIIDQSQQQTLNYFAEMIKDSEYRQQQKFNNSMINFSKYIESQRKNDLQIFNHGLEGLHQVTEEKFIHTNDVLKDLINYSSFRIEK